MKKIFLPLLILSLILSSCTNISDNNFYLKNSFSNGNKSSKILVKGSVNLSGAVPSEIADAISPVTGNNNSRAAIPSIPADKNCFVTATCSKKNPVTVEATYNDTTKKYEFEIGLSEGNWTFTAELKINTGTANEKVLLKDTATRNLTSDDLTLNLPFFLKPLTEGTGDIELEVSFDSSLIDRVEYVPSAECKAEWENGSNHSSTSSGDAELIYKGLKAGSYDITFLFKNGNALVYCATQTINVFANMTTDEWISGGDADPIDANGFFVVSSSMISTFARTTFYVDSTNGSDETGTGSAYSPLKNVASAIKRISSNDSGSNYNIFVADGHVESVTSILTINRNICLRAYKNFPGDDSGTFTLERSFSDRTETIKVASGFSFEVHNAIIQGKNQNINISSSSGIVTDGNLKLYDCIIQKFSSTNGGGMTVYSGSVLLSNTKVLDNTGKCNGGGIQISGGTVIFESGEISHNTTGEATYSGAAEGVGGGVYITQNGSFTMKGGTIKQNTCNSNGTGGAGVGLENGIFNFSGGTIQDNTGGLGKGIYFYNGNLNISGSASLSEDNDIYITSGKFITVKENLTPKNENGVAQTTVAYLNTASPQANQIVLSAETEALLKNNIDKFEIKTPGWGVVQGSSANSTKGVLSPVLYVAGDGSGITGSDTTGDGTKANPYATITKAIESAVAETKIYIAGTQTIASGIEITQNYSLQKWPGTESQAKIQYTSVSDRLFRVSALKKFEISDIDIEGPDVQSNQSAGAAIYNSGTLILNNVNLSKFKISTGTGFGGCLYNAAGTISITGGSIKSCVSAQGGAIYNAGNDIEIKDCTINSCQAVQAGGAIFNNTNSKITLTGNTVIGDTTTDSIATDSNYGNKSDVDGGAIHLENGELYLKDNTIIARNYAGYSGGGGIYLKSGDVYLQDNASIKNCATSSDGNGIYVFNSSCNVYMKDSVYLDSASDIMVRTNACVTLTGNLTPPEEAGGIAATITPKTYTAGTTILKENTAGLITGNYLKFAVTSQTSTPSVEWYITANGELNSKLPEEILLASLSEAPTDTTKVYITDTSGELAPLVSWVNAGKPLENIKIKLNSDITIDEKWTTPIGYFTSSTDNKPFKGKFDGNNKTITFNSSGKSLFGYTESAEISKIKIAGTYTPDVDYDGPIVNRFKGGKISDCINSATITSTKTVGGIVGYAQYIGTKRTCIIENCINTGNITTYADAGGIIGIATSVIIRNCYNSGTITANGQAGGISGYDSGTDVRFTEDEGNLYENCGNAGNITSHIYSTKNSAGGITGGASIYDEAYYPYFINCWSSGTILDDQNESGGICGSIEDFCGEFTNCYYKTGSANYPVKDESSSVNGISTFNSESDLVNKLNTYKTSNNKTDYKEWIVKSGKVVFSDM